MSITARIGKKHAISQSMPQSRGAQHDSTQHDSTASHTARELSIAFAAQPQDVCLQVSLKNCESCSVTSSLDISALTD